MQVKHYIILILFQACLTCGFSQAPVDGFFNSKGSTVLALSGSFEKYDSYYWGNGNLVDYIDNYYTDAFSLYASYAVTDHVAVSANIPYLHIHSSDYTGQVSRNGFQDFSVYIKYNILKYTFNKNVLALTPAIGFSSPLSDYETDVFGLGQHATGFDLRYIAQLKNSSGLFAELQFGAFSKFNPAPPTFSYQAGAGYAGKKVYIQLGYSIQKAAGGLDLPYASVSQFTALGVSYTKVAGTCCYALSPLWSACISASTTLSGENIGKSSRISTALVYKLN